MLAELFDDGTDDLDGGDTQSTLANGLHASNKKSKLIKPPEKRSSVGFVGLENQ
jgi:hypothetical protein